MTIAVQLRLPSFLEERVRQDLSRPHAFASERVGFISVRTGKADANTLLLLLADYHSIPDEHYIKDPTSGARIGSRAIREAMQRVMDDGRGAFHVHVHPGQGEPNLSKMDQRELPRLVSSLRNVGPKQPHGLILFSEDSWTAWVWLPGSRAPIRPEQLSIVGRPQSISFFTQQSYSGRGERFGRQSFLGDGAQAIIERAKIGIVGLGGGGSHIVQQCAYLGFKRFRLFDADVVNESNLNRLVGAWATDVPARTPKTEVARRTINAVTSNADVGANQSRWQERPEVLRGCDVVFGCVDSFAERRELEVACRRYLIPYIDIGMDVVQIGMEPPRMAGQVILSMPGAPCMFCLGFLREELLALEASRYGTAGDRPQVVWSNGVLASIAVGIGIELLTGWTRAVSPSYYLSYDGNMGWLSPHVRLSFLTNGACPHFPLSDAGDPVFRPVRQGGSSSL